jgi:hypothetical protein
LKDETRKQKQIFSGWQHLKKITNDKIKKIEINKKYQVNSCEFSKLESISQTRNSLNPRLRFNQKTQYIINLMLGNEIEKEISTS